MMFGKPMSCFLKNKAKRPASCKQVQPAKAATAPKALTLKQQIQNHNKKFGTFK